ncbi:MAG: hypothetical protein EXR00_03670 [Alphaproteobacteria bacterium]|nr:hypothetical protein [Alphaproteobacteria bacterium]
MTKKYLVAATAAALLGTLAIGPSAAQPNRYDNNPYNDSQFDRGGPGGRFEERMEQAYRDGYRRGFDDSRARRRFDDRYVSAGPPPGRGAGPGRDLDRDNRWRARYARTYTRDDDVYYRECRQTADPAGIIVGGLLGNAIGNGSGGATGAALTRNLDCDDRSYAYKTYSDGFNSGRRNATYQWRNPRNNHRGDFVVGDYYDDPDGFRCATYTQRV